MSTWLTALLIFFSSLAGVAQAAVNAQDDTVSSVVVYRDNTDEYKGLYFKIRLNNGQIHTLKRGRELRLESLQLMNQLTINDRRNTQFQFDAIDGGTTYVRAVLVKGRGYYYDLSLSSEEEYVERMNH